MDVRNPKFDVDDLKKLIKSTTQDLEKADRERKDDFKRYEMEKKFEEEERLKHIEDEAKRYLIPLRTRICVSVFKPSYFWL